MSSTAEGADVGSRAATVGGCPVFHDSGGAPSRGRPFRVAAMLYGLFGYAVFCVVFVYAIGFVENVAVPRSVDHGIDASTAEAITVNLALLTLFALQHSVMARPAFKRWWTRIVPVALERSTYVLLASGALGLLCWQWRALGPVIWNADATWARTALYVLSALGWLMVLAATFMIDHFELFGLRQVVANWQSKQLGDKGFRTVLLYRLVRHPLMLGFLIAFWAAPTMTAAHLLFACVSTVYVLIALRFEERDLTRALGEPYRRYRERVPMLVPRLWR